MGGSMNEQTCSFAGCTNRITNMLRGLCRTHYLQFLAGKELTQIKKHIRTSGKCAFPNCGRPIRSRGLCKSHYAQQLEGKTLTALVERIPDGAVCAFSGCEGPQYSIGLCHGHYSQHYAGKELTPLRTVLNKDRTCEFPGCINKVRARGLCYTHADQRNRGVQLTPIRPKLPRQRALELRAQGLGHCYLCDRNKDLSEFPWDHGRDVPHSYCKRCKAIKRKAIQNNLTFAFVEALYKYQEDRCAICGSANGEPGDGSDWLQMDHWGGCCARSSKEDKTCGKCVRGLLCGACNSRLLSWYEQAPDRLRTITEVNDYLTNWPAQVVRRQGIE